jgi:hypothetical protein
MSVDACLPVGGARREGTVADQCRPRLVVARRVVAQDERDVVALGAL